MSRLDNVYWLYVLHGTICVNSIRYYAKESFILNDLPLDVYMLPGTIAIAIDRDRMAKI
jgi:hypothetical protein